MAPTKRSVKAKGKSSSSNKTGPPPPPFKQPPEILRTFIEALSPKHVYITHIDSKPVSFKRKIFLVPVALNLAVTAFFAWRMYNIVPWYFKVIISGLGRVNETTFPFDESTWQEFGVEVASRLLTFVIDFVLTIFVWPWPLEFVAGIAHGNPCQWRWNVGFRDKEIYVRRSRDWDMVLGDIFEDDASHKIITAYITQATRPMLQEQKTGYLLMNAQWDLDWDAMVHAHHLVDKKEIALDAFRNAVLVHHEAFGWLCYDIKTGGTVQEDETRRQVFAFRDALTSMGKENLFYRWVEIVQFEASQPGGFGPEKQEAAAKQIRELFQKEDVDFDQLWQDTVGTPGPTGM